LSIICWSLLLADIFQLIWFKIVHLSHVSAFVDLSFLSDLLISRPYLFVDLSHMSTLLISRPYLFVDLSHMSTLLICWHYSFVDLTHMSTLLIGWHYSFVDLTHLSTLLICWPSEIIWNKIVSICCHEAPKKGRTQFIVKSIEKNNGKEWKGFSHWKLFMTKNLEK
jgi:hypothetical protein